MLLTTIKRQCGQWARRGLPPAGVRWLRSVWDCGVELATRGSGCQCPACGKEFRCFVIGGVVPRPRAACPACHALERHRLTWLYLERETNLTDGAQKRLLHIAPEPQIAERLQRMPQVDYLSADIEPGRAMIELDLTECTLPTAEFDVIFCSHVLEHIEADERAMDELFRLVRPGGWALLLVPIHGERTLEDPSVRTSQDRLRVFGQEDHVRIYGLDGEFQRRLERAGFQVRAERYASHFTRDERARWGLSESTWLFQATRPEVAPT